MVLVEGFVIEFPPAVENQWLPINISVSGNHRWFDPSECHGRQGV